MYSNVEIAKRIITNFLKANPNKTPKDFLIGKYSLAHITTFRWSDSPEGWVFWEKFYGQQFCNNDKEINKFLKKYYFDYNKDSIFINIEVVL